MAERAPLRSLPNDPPNNYTGVFVTDELNYFQESSIQQQQQVSNTPASSSSLIHDNKEDNPDGDSLFICNICYEHVENRDPVVTQCGHLYCWSCIYRWISTNHQTCPVCKAGTTRGMLCFVL